jgi:oxidase EvaA
VYTRSVLSCLSFAGVHRGPAGDWDRDDFHQSLIRSYRGAAGSRHSTDGILRWIAKERTRTEVSTRMLPLRGLPGWRRTDERIYHESGRFFDVIGIRVTAGGREVSQWTQPIIESRGLGVVAFLVRSIGGVLHALVHTRVEAGCLDVLELAPTVQCIPENYAHLPAAARPRFLDEVLSAGPDRIRFEAVLSEPGGRLYQARSRHLIVVSEVDESPEYPDFRWIAVHQLVDLLRHSNYLNVQARSLVCCLHSLSAVRVS